MNSFDKYLLKHLLMEKLAIRRVPKVRGSGSMRVARRRSSVPSSRPLPRGKAPASALDPRKAAPPLKKGEELIPPGELPGAAAALPEGGSFSGFVDHNLNKALADIKARRSQSQQAAASEAAPPTRAAIDQNLNLPLVDTPAAIKASNKARDAAIHGEDFEKALDAYRRKYPAQEARFDQRQITDKAARDTFIHDETQRNVDLARGAADGGQGLNWFGLPRVKDFEKAIAAWDRTALSKQQAGRYRWDNPKTLADIRAREAIRQGDPAAQPLRTRDPWSDTPWEGNPLVDQEIWRRMMAPEFREKGVDLSDLARPGEGGMETLFDFLVRRRERLGTGLTPKERNLGHGSGLKGLKSRLVTGGMEAQRAGHAAMRGARNIQSKARRALQEWREQKALGTGGAADTAVARQTQPPREPGRIREALQKWRAEREAARLERGRTIMRKERERLDPGGRLLSKEEKLQWRDDFAKAMRDLRPGSKLDERDWMNELREHLESTGQTNLLQEYLKGTPKG